MALIPVKFIFSIIGFSTTEIFKILFSKLIFTSLKKPVSYNFFKIVFTLLSSISSSIEIDENIFIVSLGIRSFPNISIFFKISE